MDYPTEKNGMRKSKNWIDYAILNLGSKSLFGDIYKKDSFDVWENYINEFYNFILNNIPIASNVKSGIDFYTILKNQRIFNINVVGNYTKFYRDYMYSTHSWSILSTIRIIQLKRKSNDKESDIDDSVKYIEN